jgi:putative phage-type endonuclease
MSLCDLPPRVQALFGRDQYEQRTPAWYEVRRELLTASDAAAALDVKPFASFRGSARAELLRKKLANEPLNNVFVAHGVKYEDEARDLMCAALGERVFEFGLLRHRGLPWLGASPDGITATGRLVEIKCPLRRDIVPGQVPHHYWPQIQVQMEVCDLDETIFVQYKPSSLTGGAHELDIVVVARDRQWFSAVRADLHAFWAEYMAARETYVPPPPPPPPRCLVREDLYVRHTVSSTHDGREILSGTNGIYADALA